MKLASYEINGRRSYGVVTDQEVLISAANQARPRRCVTRSGFHMAASWRS